MSRSPRGWKTVARISAAGALVSALGAGLFAAGRLESGSADPPGTRDRFELTATFRPDPNAVELPLDYDNYAYSDRFTFARIRFEPPRYRRGPFYWGLDLKWNHDYPWGEENFTRILGEYTSLTLNEGGGDIYSLNEAALFKRPFAYLCEVGFWDPSDQEAENLRAWLLKGGFLVVDDFVQSRALENFLFQMERVLPGYTAVELDVSHPVFDSFFHIETLDFEHIGRPDLVPVYYGFFENNDPDQRLMVIANYNHDIGDYWEWSGNAYWPVDLTNEAFKLGVNYVIYGMIH
ncbi:MAG: DUF4159 domain-containing protein [Acidobacteriota bacterium]|nr:DUF4159 domain-containing protein [Acidobacteriota bacterium]MDE3260404.1 DUF4159 domain-containing protein [Acidobacteriota bacterium]